MCEPCRDGAGAGDTARATGVLLIGGRGDTARRLDGPLAGGAAGGGLSRLSTDDLFMDEYGDFVLTVPLVALMPPARSRSRAAAAGFGAPAAA